MASTINASTTLGLQQSADTSGVLQLQTANTTALSIDASQNVTFTNQPVYTGGTANGVAYLNGSKVLTTGSALTFDGTNLAIGASSANTRFDVAGANAVTDSRGIAYIYSTDSMAVDKGGQLGLGGSSTGTTQTPFAGIAGRKENGTDANVAGYLQFATRGASGGVVERMRLDSAGNLGLGVTPSAWTAGWKALELPGGTSFCNNAGDRAAITWNAVVIGGVWTYKTSAAANRYEQTGGAHYWYNAASGTAGNTISFTQAMTLQASGGLSLGVTTDP